MDNNLERLRSIQSLSELFAYLRDVLAWEFETDEVEDLTYDYTVSEFNLDPTTAAKIRQIKQIRPLVDQQPWGIFYLDFAGQNLSVTVLRAILRGLVARKRASANESDMRKWQLNNLLFICTSDSFQNFNFAYFRGEQVQRAVLSTFGWRVRDTHLRTLAEYNILKLRFPEDPANTQAWLEEWRRAFDVEAVTDRFFSEYHELFDAVVFEVRRSVPDDAFARLYTQRLFNRLMFVYFIQKKGWLSFKGDKNYLRALFNTTVAAGENFLRDRLEWLFFWGLSNVNDSREANSDNNLIELRGEVPYLNGGLFDREDEYDGRGRVAVNNETFARILDLFEHYNFTVEESTPLNVQVAIDPEMLGKVFEELVTGREARQDAGRYYTPRSIVSFMCRESLKKHLGGYSALIDDRDTRHITVSEANDLLERLNRLKIVDPACGSGAYLLGMLHELHALVNLLQTRATPTTSRDDYKLKLNIIERTIYGVDNDNLAIQIARFRLWLSLIIEYDDREGISELPTLPNLDFKIECGDSLTAPNPQNVKRGSFRTDLISEYQKAKAEFLSAHGSTKGNLKKRIKKLSDEIREEAAFWLYGNVTFKGFDWAIEFAEVFDSGGFDIVLANPPYGATVADNVRDLYFNREVEGVQSKDTYGLFIARGLQLLRDEGQLCFIVSDTWRTIKSHRPLRRRLAELTTVWHVLDLPSWVFNATVNTGILTLTKRAPTEDHQLIAGDLRGIGRADWDTLTKNLSAVAAHGVDIQTLTYARYTYAQSLVSTYKNVSFFIASPKMYSLMNNAESRTLRDIATVKVGLQTSDNGYYLRKRPQTRGNYQILDEAKLLSETEIDRLTPDEKWNGIDPKRHNGKFIVPFDKGGESEAAEGWMPNYYVPTNYYIDWSQTSVQRLLTHTSEKQSGRVAARFQNREYYFRKGITFSPTGIYSPTFRIGSGAIFGNKGSTIFFANNDEILYLGLLASKTAKYLLKNYLSHTVETGEEVLLSLILPEIPPDVENEIRERVAAIIDKQKTNPYYSYHQHEQQEIDTFVYGLYRLSQDDVREVELWYCRRYPLLAAAQGTLQEIKDKYADHLSRSDYILSKSPEYWRSHPLLKRIAEDDENQTFELKESLEVNEHGKIDAGTVLKTLKTIAAFLNSDGGTLLIGVSDRGEIKGIAKDVENSNHKNVDGFKLKLRDIIRGRISPDPREYYTVNIEHLPEGDVCEINVLPSPEITLVDKDDLYIRVDNRTEKLLGAEKVNWIRNRG